MTKATMAGRLLLWATMAGLCAGPAVSQGFLRASGGRIVDAQDREVTFRGIGLGGWMLQEPYMLRISSVAVNQSQFKAKITDLIGAAKTENFYASWRMHQTRKEDIDSLASWGFNSVRVPLHFNLFTLPVAQEPIAGQNTWLETGFTLIDSLVSWCRANHIYIILDLHAAPGGQGNDLAIADRDPTQPALWQSRENQQKMVALWHRLAERYLNEPWIGGYDLLNETNWGFSSPTDEHGCAETGNGPLKALLEETTAAIRSVDKKHLIFVEGNCWANNFRGLLPPWDSNMAISFHKYWNYNDQGSVQGMLDLRTKYDIPLWLGESGENSNTWTTDAIGLMERNDISWTWWPLKKAGLNNPLEYHLNEGFRKIIAYWEGKAPRPSADEAYTALMQLASEAATPYNTFHKDVVDAMFRQVVTGQTLPYQTVDIRPGTRIYAVDYDLGRNGYAYYDQDTANFKTSTGHFGAWNKGGYYRNDGVSITSCTDSLTNGYAVTDIQDGEWLQYTVSIPRSGDYQIGYRIEPLAGAWGGWKLLEYTPDAVHVLDSSVLPEAVSPIISAVSTSGPHALTPPSEGITVPEGAGLDGARWLTAGHAKVFLTAGVHQLRLLARGAGFRLNYIVFE